MGPNAPRTYKGREPCAVITARNSSATQVARTKNERVCHSSTLAHLANCTKKEEEKTPAFRAALVSFINRKTCIEKNRKNKRPATNPQTRNFRQCGRAQLAFLRALRLAPQSTKSQQKKTHVHSGIRTRNRQYAYILVPRPLPAPSMLVLAGQNRKWALSDLFCT